MSTPFPLTGPSTTTLFQFITQLSSTITEPTKIVFTGHSLGGALAPTLALTLLLSKALVVESGGLDALVYPTAGPSPGNLNFQTLCSGSFPSSSATKEKYKYWNTNIINSLDIVSQAWCIDPTLEPRQNMTNIPGIYGSRPFIIPALIANLMATVKSSMITYIPLQSTIFTSTIPLPYPTPMLPKGFWHDAMAEHTAAFTDYFGIRPGTFPKDCPGGAGCNSMSEDEEIRTYPVIGHLVALESESETET
jgi:hypothetical protein